jgi:hypothetical protein
MIPPQGSSRSRGYFWDAMSGRLRRLVLDFYSVLVSSKGSMDHRPAHPKLAGDVPDGQPLFP